MSASSPEILPPGADQYGTEDVHDEALQGGGVVRAPYAQIMAALADEDLGRLAGRVEDGLRDGGVTFGGEDAHDFVVDPVPRLLAADEWRAVRDGLRQRIRALDAFVADVYGAQRAVAEGVVPEDLVSGCVYLEEDLLGSEPRPGAWVSVAGLDLVRDGEGRFRVLEDNVRTPSGLAYALAASDAVAAALPDVTAPADARAPIRDALRRVLEAAGEGLEGELVLLSDGEANSAWYEHRVLAELAGLRLVGLGDLRRSGPGLALTDGTPVRAIYRRTDQDRLREGGTLTDLGELLAEPLRDGAVGIVNRFGTGIADDKRLYAHVEDLIRLFLGEEPLLPSVRTYDLGERETLDEVLDRLDELVVKPRGGHGGTGVLIGRTASPAERDEAAAELRADPAGWIAQDEVALSTHPTVVDGRLAPRHVDLRPFVFFDGTDAVVPPGGLTRVALREGSMVVNSSQQGGGKATWVLEDDAA